MVLPKRIGRTPPGPTTRLASLVMELILAVIINGLSTRRKMAPSWIRLVPGNEKRRWIVLE